MFFAAGGLISFTSCISLLFPGSFLEPMWRLNPRAREAFQGMSGNAIILLGVVCIACTSAAIGLWGGKKWGYLIALSLLIVNLLGDTANVLLGIEPRAVIGIPIVMLLLFYLSRRSIREFFNHEIY